MNQEEIIQWLLKGDVSIQYQAYRDLLGIERKDLQDRISAEGWGARFLAKQNSKGHWGRDYYSPKWTSTHYTLLDIRNLCPDPQLPKVRSTIDMLLDRYRSEDGGMMLGPSTSRHSDVCVNAMFLNIASYFGYAADKRTEGLIDSILGEIMPDGGFNCYTPRTGSKHSSLHTTISVLEGLHEYFKNGGMYVMYKIRNAIRSAEEFILMHQLYISDRTSEIINPQFLRMPYPGRWKYDILRALDYFQYSGHPWNDRMKPAVEVLLKKRNKDGTWNLNSGYSGQVHFDMEKAGKPSRWNTLRASRVLKHFQRY